MIKSVITLLILCLLLTGCLASDSIEQNAADRTGESAANSMEEDTGSLSAPDAESVTLVNPDHSILKERFLLPDGFSRMESAPDSFAAFLQSLPLKPDGSVVRYFDGREKKRDVYLAVVDYPLGDRDLQQCADAVIRLRAEYLYASGQKDKIIFHFVSGFAADYTKWADGYGISVDGNSVNWVRNSHNGDSYESFQRYLDMVYAYSSTLSLEKEMSPKEFSEMSIGDVWIIGGSPGHCVIVVDMAINHTTGEKIFMVAQSYMPAQDIQILRGGGENSPWYTTDIGDKLVTPEWTFDKTQLRTWQ